MSEDQGNDKKESKPKEQGLSFSKIDLGKVDLSKIDLSDPISTSGGVSIVTKSLVSGSRAL